MDPEEQKPKWSHFHLSVFVLRSQFILITAVLQFSFQFSVKYVFLDFGQSFSLLCSNLNYFRTEPKCMGLDSHNWDLRMQKNFWSVRKVWITRVLFNGLEWMKSKRRLRRILLTVSIMLTMFSMMLSLSAMLIMLMKTLIIVTALMMMSIIVMKILIMLMKTLIIVMALTMMFQQDEGVWRKEKKGGGDPPTLKYFIAFNKVSKDERKGTYVYEWHFFFSFFLDA